MDYPASAVRRRRWRKSTRSNQNGNAQCVEVGMEDAETYVRDSKNPNGAELAFSDRVWSSFVRAAKAGEFGRS